MEKYNELEGLELRGSFGKKLIINVPGKIIHLKDLNIDVMGRLNYKNIIWNFYEAEYVKIKVDRIESYYFIGSILAPKAIVDISAMTVLGGVFGKDIRLNIANQGYYIIPITIEN